MVMDSTGYERWWMAPMILELPLDPREKKVEFADCNEIPYKKLSQGLRDGEVGGVSEHWRSTHAKGEVAENANDKVGTSHTRKKRRSDYVQ